MQKIDPSSPDIGPGPVEELSLEKVKKRALFGIVALTGRTALLQLIALFSTFLLTIFLSPTQYGVFFLVSAVINFFSYFADIGLAAALIQKKKLPTDSELKTTFTIQQGLVLVLVLIIFVATPIFQRVYGLSDNSIHLLWALTISLIFSSLKTIPSVLLERSLKFEKLIIPQIVETVLFYTVAVFLAWRGSGIESFTVAVLIRGISGLVVMYFLSPWRPGFAFTKDPLSRLLRYGLPYQANTFLAVVKDDGMTVVLGAILGPTGVGLLGWAQKWAQAPLRFFMDQVIRVTFPAYSRMQDDKVELSRAVSHSIFYISLIVFPMLTLLIILSGPLTQIIPKYEKWQPALFALTLISINSAWAAITTPLTNMLNAIGKITVTFRLMIMWTVLTWALLPILSLRYSINGAALGYALVGTSSVLAIWWAKKFVSLDLTNSVIKPLIASFSMGMLVFLLGNIIPLNLIGIIVLIFVGLISYVTLLYFIVGGQVIEDLKDIYATIRKN